MPLKKATKSVIFHDGMGDDTDRFLLEPPAVDYAENLRIDKTGSLQKRPGFGPDALTTVPDSSGTPVAMHGMGNDLHVITEEGARTWNGTSWRETDAAGFIGSSEVELESQNFLGLASCSYQPITNVDDGSILGHVIAYEVREEGSVTGDLTGGTKHVVIQRYDENGVFVDQAKIDNARSPQVLETRGPRYVEVNTVFCQSDALAGSLIKYDIYPTSISDETTPYPLDETPIQPEHSPQMPQYAATDNGPRLGQGVYGQARYFVKYLEITDKFVVLYCAAGESVYLTVLNIDGSQDGSNSIGVVYPGDTDGDILGLDVSAGFIFIVYQQAELSGSGTPVGAWSVRVAVYGSDVSAGPDYSPIVLQSGSGTREFMPTFTHGTISTVWDAVSSRHKSLIAFHYSGFQSASALVGTGSQVDADYWYPYNNRHAEVGLRVFELDWPSLPTGFPWDKHSLEQHQSLHAHRITTNPCYFNDKWYMGVQQWIDYTPQHHNPGGCNQYVLVEPAVKPVTTAICVWEQGTKVTPVATLDAGQSGHVDYAESEVAIHLGTLVEQDGALLASNRVKLRADDNSLYLGAKSSNWKRQSNIEVGSDSLCRVHRITPGGEDVYSSEFGDGIALSTAVPVWYESSGFGEFGPLDSPEIIRVEDADYTPLDGRTNNEYMQNAPPQGYSEMPSTAESLEWRKFVCVWGYVDGRGNTHRSAPSSTLYVADLMEDAFVATDSEIWAGREVRIWVTTPLSLLPDNREYFAEIYVSSDVDTDPQLAAQFSIDISDCGTSKRTTFQLNRVAATDENVTKPVIRSTAPDYTSGGVLAADPWPSFKKSVVQSTRLWALDATNKGRVIYSKLFEDFISPEYNPTLSINLGDERDLTAIGKLDDKVVVFEPDDIHVIYGEGPDNRGQGQDFAVHYISTDVGCTDQESIIETPKGLIFYSEPRGFYLLDRNLQVQFIGGGIEDTARGINVVAATMVRDKAEVRFVFTGGPGIPDMYGPNPDTDAVDRPARPVFTNISDTVARDLPLRLVSRALTFNYERGTWLTYTNYDASATTVYQGKYTMLRNDWDIWQEKEDRWDDPEYTSLTLQRTPWIKLSESVQDFNRLWSMTVIGRYLSSLQDLGTEEYEASDVRLRIWYDYEGEYAQSKDIRVQDLGYDPFNNPPKRAERFQFEVTPQRGRCQAIKLEFSEVVSQDRGEGLTYKQGRGFEIAAVDFHVGIGPSKTLIPQRSKK